MAERQCVNQEKWFILTNQVSSATENIGMNPVNAGDTVSFVYAPGVKQEDRVLEGAKYLVADWNIDRTPRMPDIIETATQAQETSRRCLQPLTPQT